MPRPDDQQRPGPRTGRRRGPVADQNEFLEVVFDDVQNYWEAVMPNYRRATMVIFRESVNTGGCGAASSDTGPFYCPADEKVYIDASFFDVLAGPQFGAGGDFAQAYVVAHEVGHHVQKVTGVSDQVRQAQSQASSQEEVNGLSVRLELQADCLAGSWASVASRRPSTFDNNDNLLYLEAGDLKEGLEAAKAVGDNRIQESAGVRVNAESWTHGSDARNAGVVHARPRHRRPGPLRRDLRHEHRRHRHAVPVGPAPARAGRPFPRRSVVGSRRRRG
ncbi:MAG: neutral zinc metallopeptidase [Acidimicrobiales bacterium]